MSIFAEAVATSSGASAAKAWARALARTAPIRQHRSRILSTVVDEMAEKYTDRPAVISDDGILTYGALASRAHRYAQWAVDHGIRRGDAVGLLMPNRPEYLAIWLGITRVGGIVALLNTQLGGRSLAHCINQAHPSHLIVSTDLADRLQHIEHELETRPQIWVQGDRGHRAWPHIDREIDGYRGGAPAPDRSEVTVDDRALYIYTSGTTGLPKAANVSHARLMEWSHWFGGLMDAGPDDRMFNCLPMYHSVGGVLAPGAVLTAGGSVVIRDRFSTRGFWNDVVRSECTIFQYIGELCRYLLSAPPTPDETAHAIRWCCGNGLRPEVWTRFQERFHVPHILEFYASTEGNVSLVNVDGRPGAVGRVPPFLAHRFPMALIRYDAVAAAPARDARGFCVRCAPNEVGEAIGPLTARASNRTRFEGYTDGDATEQKIVRHVFEPGDAWVRTGDLMRQDEHGYCFFVDRIGDTFRWKGENVAASEVAEVLREFGAVNDVAVYGVEIPGTEGRAGMAAVVVDGELDLVRLRQHLIARLPGYARPVFLRLTNRVEATSTFKQAKTTLVREGYDPAASDDPLYVDDGERGAYVRVDFAVYQRIRSGQMRA